MNVSGKTTNLFGGDAHIILTDRAFGPVHPKHPDFAARIDDIRRAFGVDTVIAQKLGFNTRITDLVQTPDAIDDRPQTTMNIPGFLRTKDVTDGIIIPAESSDVRGRIAALLMVGDSGAVTILSPDRRLVMLNLSLECIHHSDGTSIVMNAIQHLQSIGIDPKNLQMHISASAMACCYGHNSHDPKYGQINQARAAALRNQWGTDVIRTTLHAPRKGWDGIDMPLIASRQAQALGLDPQCIQIDPLCTSHEDLSQAEIDAGNVQGRFFSAVRGALQNVLPGGWNERGAIVLKGNK